MTYLELCDEIGNLRENIMDLKISIACENNSDERRHMQYSIEEKEATLKEKLNVLKYCSSPTH